MAAPIPTEVAVKVRAELGNAVIVRPGDKLVVARSDTFSMEDGARLKAVIAERLPGVEVVIISQCTGLAVYRDEPQAIRKLSQALTEDEVQALRERCVIDGEGKSTGDRIAEYFDRDAERRKQARIDGTWQP